MSEFTMAEFRVEEALRLLHSLSSDELDRLTEFHRADSQIGGLVRIVSIDRQCREALR